MPPHPASTFCIIVMVIFCYMYLHFTVECTESQTLDHWYLNLISHWFAQPLRLGLLLVLVPRREPKSTLTQTIESRLFRDPDFGQVTKRKMAGVVIFQSQGVGIGAVCCSVAPFLILI